jgi:hypothetical protein
MKKGGSGGNGPVATSSAPVFYETESARGEYRLTQCALTIDGRGFMKWLCFKAKCRLTINPKRPDAFSSPS